MIESACMVERDLLAGKHLTHLCGGVLVYGTLRRYPAKVAVMELPPICDRVYHRPGERANRGDTARPPGASRSANVLAASAVLKLQGPLDCTSRARRRRYAGRLRDEGS